MLTSELIREEIETTDNLEDVLIKITFREWAEDLSHYFKDCNCCLVDPIDALAHYLQECSIL